jgi:hypothetical protein
MPMYRTFFPDANTMVSPSTTLVTTSVCLQPMRSSAQANVTRTAFWGAPKRPRVRFTDPLVVAVIREFWLISRM